MASWMALGFIYNDKRHQKRGSFAARLWLCDNAGKKTIAFMNEKQIIQGLHGTWHDVGDGFLLEGLHCKGGKARNITLKKACSHAGGPPAINDEFMDDNGNITVVVKLIKTRYFADGPISSTMVEKADDVGYDLVKV